MIIQTAFIGDVILATSVLENLHKSMPDAQIDFLLRKGNEGLLKKHPFINEILIWEKNKNKYSNLIKIIKQVRLNKYDYVFNIQRFMASGVIAIFSGAKKTIGFNKNPLSFLFSESIKHDISENTAIIHETERNYKLIKSLTNTENSKPCLYPGHVDFVRTEELRSSEYICIAPTSVWYTKQYPEEKWIEFINEVNDNLKIYLLGGPGDHDACQDIIDNCSHSQIKNLAGKLTFLESAALIKDAKMNYVNDSAPLHIASAMNAYVTAIFCSTIPEFGFGPLSEKSYIVQTPDKLKCRPCGLHGKKECPKKHFNCTKTIDKKHLLEKLDSNLS